MSCHLWGASTVTVTVTVESLLMDSGKSVIKILAFPLKGNLYKSSIIKVQLQFFKLVIIRGHCQSEEIITVKHLTFSDQFD